MRVGNAKPRVTGIALTSLPNKLIYEQGDAFDPAGLVITADYADGTSGATSDYTVSGYDTLTLGEQTVTVSCGKFSVTFTVTVIKPIHIHSYTKVVTEPTCTEIGYTTYTCSCGDC